ncbi:MAG: hypothetical protein KTR31_17130 [Myxococcales bacterium]|nr:hypothetical protein [Myxococcales bacterium]
MTGLLLAQVAWGSAHVLEATSERRLKRALRATRQATVERVVVQTPLRVCIELDDAEPRTLLRLTRRLRRDPESRRDCDVAWYPLGRGWIVVVAEPPALALDAALEAANITFREVARSTDAAEPVRACMARAAVAAPDGLEASLDASGVTVRAVYEVGGCRRR